MRKLLFFLITFFFFASQANAQLCNWQQYDFDNFEHSNLDPAIVLGVSYTSGYPSTHGAYNGTKGIYLNIQNGVIPGTLLYDRTYTVCPNTTYRFSAWISTRYGGAQCDMDIDILDANNNILASYSGPVQYASVSWTNWSSGNFTPTTSTIKLQIRNNVVGGFGNDFAFDDLLLEVCNPIMSHDTINVCNNSNPINLYDSLATSMSATGIWAGNSTLTNGPAGTFDPSSMLAGEYTYSITNALNCPADSIDTVTVVLHSPPVIDLGNDTLMCLGNQLIVDAGYSQSSYLWNNGDVTQFDTILTAGLYHVTTTNQCGSDSDSIQVSFIASPNIDLGNDTILCFGESIWLMDTVSFGTYQWSTSATTDSLLVLQQDVYILTATNTCGSDIDTIVVEYDTIPVIDLGNDTLICLGDSVELQVSFSRSSYLWNTTQTDSVIKIGTEGNYWVTATNLCGIGSDTLHLDIDSVLQVDIGADTILCIGDQIQLTSNVLGDSYLWNIGSTASQIQVFQQDTYSLAVSNVCGTFTDSIAIYYDTNPITNLGPDSVYCVTSLINLDATWSRATYLWNTAETTPTILVNNSGQYSVQVVNLCGYDNDTVDIYYDIPLSFNLGNDTFLCAGDSLILVASAHNATWNWNTGSMDSTITVKTKGTYSVNAQNQCGSYGDQIKIEIDSIPVPLGVPDTIICEGENIEVIVSPANSTGIIWLDTAGSSYTRTIFTPKNYIYTLSNICGSNNDTFLLENDVPVEFTLGNDTLLCTGDKVSKTFDFPGHTFYWSDGDTSSSKTIYHPGTYDLTIFTPYGCESSSEIFIDKCVGQLFIPSAFSPDNGDNLNDEFVIYGNDIERFSIQIFDRWGNNVFTSNDILYSWDGTHKGELSPEAVYSYHIWYGSGNQSEELWGRITLVR